jgi:hypothetical protein
MARCAGAHSPDVRGDARLHNVGEAGQVFAMLRKDLTGL